MENRGFFTVPQALLPLTRLRLRPPSMWLSTWVRAEVARSRALTSEGEGWGFVLRASGCAVRRRAGRTADSELRADPADPNGDIRPSIGHLERLPAPSVPRRPVSSVTIDRGSGHVSRLECSSGFSWPMLSAGEGRMPPFGPAGYPRHCASRRRATGPPAHRAATLDDGGSCGGCPEQSVDFRGLSVSGVARSRLA